MNPEIKQKWLEALRSDNYAQGTGWLKRDDCFCCLGVLCDLYSKETGHKWEPSIIEDGPDKFISEGQVLPTIVREWAGLENCNPEVKTSDCNTEQSTSIAELNDSGASFEDLAEIIKEQL